ncbi:MAG: sigma-54-dependent Fis family transcriptional regulator [Calditrichia bacterium]|nr:sigma-54-dependent Fis family transcriptional regulator [Calditrichia bacterium]
MSLGNVMVVDDEVHVQEVLKDFLEQLGYTVTLADDGDDALSKFVPDEFDLIISDLLMPKIDGLELLKKIKRQDKKVVFLMITGYPSIETAVDAIKKGAYDYITKPFNMEDVRFRIEKAFEKKQMKESLKTMNGLVWALVISIPIWLILGIILAIFWN